MGFVPGEAFDLAIWQARGMITTFMGSSLSYLNIQQREPSIVSLRYTKGLLESCK
jgi:hypothetical protein